MDIMVTEAPQIQAALGMGILPLFINTVDSALNALDELIIEGIVLVWDVSTVTWDLAKPLRRMPPFKKIANATKHGLSRAANATKSTAIEGW